MAQIVVEMTGDEARLWRSYQKIAKKQTEVEGGLKKIKGAAGKAGDSMKRAWQANRS